MPTWLLYRVASVVAFIGTLSCAIFGALLANDAFGPQGNPAGDMLIGGVGILCLLISPILLTFGVVAWRKASEADRIAEVRLFAQNNFQRVVASRRPY